MLYDTGSTEISLLIQTCLTSSLKGSCLLHSEFLTGSSLAVTATVATTYGVLPVTGHGRGGFDSARGFSFAGCVRHKGTRCAHDKLAWPEAHADSPPSSLRVEEYSACGCARHETSSVHAAAALCDPRLAVSLAPVPRRLTGIRSARRHQHQHHHSASGLHQHRAAAACG